MTTHELETEALPRTREPLRECSGPERLRRVADIIEIHPDAYNQSSWYDKNICGTTYCIAGWAMTDAGYDVDPDTADFYRPDGTRVDNEIADGAQLLGLDREEAETLFLGIGPLVGDDVPATLRAIADGAEVHEVWE